MCPITSARRKAGDDGSSIGGKHAPGTSLYATCVPWALVTFSLTTFQDRWVFQSEPCSGEPIATASPRRFAPRSPIYNTRDDIDAHAALTAQGAGSLQLMSEMNELYQEVILDHNWRPRNFRAIEPPIGQTGRLQPALWRPADAVSSRSTTTCIADVAFQGSGLRHLEGLGVADDRSAEGQDRGRGARRCSSGFTR